MMAGPRADLGVGRRVSNDVAGPNRAGPKAVDPIVNGFSIGAGVGYGPGFRPGTGGYWRDPRNDGECILGYVCPANERSCNRYAYETCDSYSFHPMTASMDLHEVKINWAKSKPVTMAQHGVDAKPTRKAQHGV